MQGVYLRCQSLLLEASPLDVGCEHSQQYHCIQVCHRTERGIRPERSQEGNQKTTTRAIEGRYTPLPVNGGFEKEGYDVAHNRKRQPASVTSGAYARSCPSCPSYPMEAPQLVPPGSNVPPEVGRRRECSLESANLSAGPGGGTPTGLLPMCRLRECR